MRPSGLVKPAWGVTGLGGELPCGAPVPDRPRARYGEWRARGDSVGAPGAVGMMPGAGLWCRPNGFKCRLRCLGLLPGQMGSRGRKEEQSWPSASDGPTRKVLKANVTRTTTPEGEPGLRFLRRKSELRGIKGPAQDSRGLEVLPDFSPFFQNLYWLPGATTNLTASTNRSGTSSSSGGHKSKADVSAGLTPSRVSKRTPSIPSPSFRPCGQPWTLLSSRLQNPSPSL